MSLVMLLAGCSLPPPQTTPPPRPDRWIPDRWIEELRAVGAEFQPKVQAGAIEWYDKHHKDLAFAVSSYEVDRMVAWVEPGAYSCLKSDFNKARWLVVDAAFRDAVNAGSMRSAAERMDRYKEAAERALDDLWRELKGVAFDAMLWKSVLSR